MSAFTPGPWTRQAGETFTRLGDSRIVAANRISPAIVFGGLGDESEANARLISAAPDLLEACREWLEFLDILPASTEFTYGSGLALVKARELARAAIAKATQEGR